MHPTLSGLLSTVLIGAVVLFILYRRFRRNIGRQRLRPTAMWIRVGILSLVCVLLLASPFRTGMSIVAAAVGIVIGIGLGFYALAHTRFETTPEGRFYTPNGYIGMGVTALLIGRLIYRFTVVYPVIHSAAQQAAQDPQLQASPFAAYQRSPLTLGIYFLLAGYYICYYVSVILKSRSLR
ncbi:MAG TPA: DUF1453 domain-containing protein [Gammaproteobacteria bacterium]|jgi:hypothetical protein|nr:DUF1453 domain-containing protein [Gammaproteobacteria bacterium]